MTNYYCAHISPENQVAWDTLVANNAAAGFHQSFAWANFKQAQDWETYKIGVFSDADKKLVGGCVLQKFSFADGTNFLYIPEGPVLDYYDEDTLFWQWRSLETAIHSIISLVPEQLTTHIRMEPRTVDVPAWFLTGFRKAPINLQPRHTQVLDLTITEPEILSQMKPKGRYNIRLAEKKGVRVFEATAEQLSIFYNLYHTTYRRNKFDGKDIIFFQTFVAHCGNISRIFIAESQGVALAGAIVVYFGNRATYFYGGSSNDARECMAPSALHWHIIQDAKARGYHQYDFWGVAKDETDVTHDWHGLTRFKKQFGGTQLNFMGAYDYVIQKKLYEAFVKKHESD